MLSKVNVAAAMIAVSALGVSSSANAAEVSLQYVVDTVVSRAVSATANEVSQNVYNAIANTAYSFGLEAETYETKVLISKVEKAQEEKQKTAE
ncbi:hypothetical protein KIH87_02970 [Paraneptunicella aestuarii]|uniref:hypothetical protein n=1 Tax=Paraneptunicella aestuarii TaxID=2831148 RepID=UPI001E2DD079|nr:hypothetical protein [Paraneptunicella aestuarii]UAA39343.1 hypothetical protein KIH87_02970 [Paraneptunicella aestuarii]